MLRLALFTIAAVNAESESMEMESMEMESEHLRRLRRTRLTADGETKIVSYIRASDAGNEGAFVDGDKTGFVYIEGNQKDGGKSVEWTVEAYGLDTSGACPNGFNWHIHKKPVNGAATDVGGRCGGGATGGHTDPTFACGGASEYNGKLPDGTRDPNSPCSKIQEKVCTTDAALNAGTDACDGATRKYNCGRDDLSSQRSCEYGDLSGKFGAITNGNKKYTDYHAGNLADYDNDSIVLHCCTSTGCSARIACANNYPLPVK